MESFAPTPSSNHPRKVLVYSLAALLVLSASTLLLIRPSISSRHSSSPALSKPRLVTFTEHLEYYDLTKSGDGNWTRLLPPNGGFVVQKTDAGDYEMAGVTMFHQLHCLAMIRAAIQDLKAGAGHQHMREQSEMRGPHPDQEHWVHCLDYLLQGILCAADETVEAAHDGDLGRVVDGYGVQHVCRDPDAVWAKVMGLRSRPGWRQETEFISETIA